MGETQRPQSRMVGFMGDHALGTNIALLFVRHSKHK